MKITVLLDELLKSYFDEIFLNFEFTKFFITAIAKNIFETLSHISVSFNASHFFHYYSRQGTKSYRPIKKNASKLVQKWNETVIAIAYNVVLWKSSVKRKHAQKIL